MADQDNRVISPAIEIIHGGIQISEAVFQTFVSGTAELREVSGAADPVMPARVDDETMGAAFGKLLSEGNEGRQVKIHRNAMHEKQREIRRSLVRSKEEPVKPLVIGRSERAELGVEEHHEIACCSIYVIDSKLNRLDPRSLVPTVPAVQT